MTSIYHRPIGMTDSTSRKRVLSGMRPTGRLHLGNYMGALYNWVRLQEEYECYFFIADIHALTTDYADPSKIHQNTMEVALDFLGAGLDPEKCTIFVQSHVPQHSELHVLFSMITPLSWLERVPTYKDQQEQLRAKDLNTYGFLGYPLLQAADILLYQPHLVPVGQDQVSHVELTREIARRFNQFYGRESFSLPVAANAEPKTIVLPEPDVLLTPSPKLPGLDGRKMSKSYGNFISLTDDPAVVVQKMVKMTNGGQRIVQSDPGDPDICPVGDMHSLFSSELIDSSIRRGCREATIACENCKISAGGEIVRHLKPIQDRRAIYEKDPSLVIDILDKGAAKAREAAERTMTVVRSAVGLGRSLHDVTVEPQWIESLHRGSKRTYDLSTEENWWNEENDAIRSRNIRGFWLSQALPKDIVLREDSPRVFITASRKRAIVTTSRETPDTVWQFDLVPKTYEFLTLLCWGRDRLLRDFVVPQKIYVEAWNAAKRLDKKAEVHFSVIQEEENFFLVMPGVEKASITEFQSAYELLQ